MAQATKAQMIELKKQVEILLDKVDKIKSKFDKMEPSDATGSGQIKALLEATLPIRELQKKLMSDNDPSTETEENVAQVIAYLLVLSELTTLAEKDTPMPSYKDEDEDLSIEEINQLFKLAADEQNKHEVSSKPVGDERAAKSLAPAAAAIITSPKASRSPIHNLGVPPSHTEKTPSSSLTNISMMVLGGFIAAAGIAAVAIAFTLLNAATFGVSGLILASVGVATILSGVGLFATAAYKNRQAIPDPSLDYAPGFVIQ